MKTTITPVSAQIIKGRISSSLKMIKGFFMITPLFLLSFISVSLAESTHAPLPIPPFQAKSTLSAVAVVSDLSVYAYPNPYVSSVNFKIMSPKPGSAFLDIFDENGYRLATIIKRDLKANVNELIKYRVPASVTSDLYYRLTVNDNSVSGVVICGR